jgi:hypothetical protein
MGFFQLLGYEWNMNGIGKWLEENGLKKMARNGNLYPLTHYPWDGYGLF